MKDKFIEFYLNVAHECSKLSHAKRLQVGAVAVRDTNILAWSYNGTPAGWDNNCEDIDWCSAGGWLGPEEIEERWPFSGFYLDADGNQMAGRYRLVTKPDVVHAEKNLICKAAKYGVSLKDAIMFITHAPCQYCATSIVQSGIRKIYYAQDYRDLTGVEKLQHGGIEVIKWSLQGSTTP